jgi:hypothetical protein
MKKFLKSAINQLGFDLVKSNRFANLRDDEIAFLHIGKNAGTQVMNVAVKLKDYGVNIHRFGHGVKLSQLPNDAKYFFQ